MRSRSQLDMVDAEGLKKLRANAGDTYTLVSFWATWCGSCVAEFADMQDTLRMYSDRGFNLVTVSANAPDEKSSVQKFLERKHATSRNLLFASDDTAALQKAFDPHWESAVPYTVLLAPGGQVLFSTTGSVDMLELRRKILASVPAAYIGFQKYWIEIRIFQMQRPSRVQQNDQRNLIGAGDWCAAQKIELRKIVANAGFSNRSA